MVNGIVSLISLFDFSLLVCRNAVDLCINLISVTLLYSLYLQYCIYCIHSYFSDFLVGSLGFSI